MRATNWEVSAEVNPMSAENPSPLSPLPTCALFQLEGTTYLVTLVVAEDGTRRVHNASMLGSDKFFVSIPGGTATQPLLFDQAGHSIMAFSPGCTYLLTRSPDSDARTLTGALRPTRGTRALGREAVRSRSLTPFVLSAQQIPVVE